MKYLELVINSGLFEDISKSDYIYAFDRLKIYGRNYKKGETVFYEGDVIDKICIVVSGSVRSEKAYPDGEIHIVELFDEGAFFGLEIAASRTKISAIDYISNEDCEIVYITMQSIEKSTYAAAIKNVLMKKLADDNVIMSHKIEILAERGLRNRILVYFDILMNKAGTNEITVKMNREQMAQFLCVNRSALSNELNKMKKEGILGFKKDGFIILKR
ncbi:MAG: Crp/Fnr family transcriptional regulator [Bacillota bacterium]|nr:Crp/Fnr family transcriptional regulator [Bacillota bacterium]